MKHVTGQEWIIAAAILTGVAIGFFMRWIWKRVKRLFSRRERGADYMLAVALFLAFAAFIIFITTL